MTLAQKLIKGSIWNSISQFGSQLINFVTTIFLARLLRPDDFGLFGMVYVITSFFGYFTEFGLTPSLIRKKEIDEIDKNTVFWGTVFLAIFFYFIAFLCAPLVSLYYDERVLTKVTRNLFVIFLIMPLGFIPRVIKVRKLDYRLISITVLVSTFISSIIAIIFAKMGFGVWCIVFQNIIREIITNTLLLLFSSWKPQFIFSFQRFKELLSFGIHFTLNNLLKFTTNNIDFFIVGKILGAFSLGVYTFAFKLSKYPILKVYSIFGKMMFPAFSTMQDDLNKIRWYTVAISLTSLYFFIPFYMFLYWFIGDIISITVKDKWIDAIPIVKILIIYLIVESFSFQDESILIAINRVKLLNSIKILYSSFIAIFGIFAVKHYGLVGIAWVYSIVSIIGITTIKFFLFKEIELNIKLYIMRLLSFVLVYICFFSTNAILFYIKENHFSDKILLFLFISFLINVLVFIVFSLLFKFISVRPFKINPLNIVKINDVSQLSKRNEVKS